MIVVERECRFCNILATLDERISILTGTIWSAVIKGKDDSVFDGALADSVLTLQDVQPLEGKGSFGKTFEINE